ncbi:MAG: hypothetical protein HY547_05050 [Elusimicrobia bacterium]|nr:hypothetical protein [Elusimicrobiota bacterium]
MNHSSELSGMPQKNWRQFLPVIAILASILLFTAIAVAVRGAWSAPFAMRMFMGSFFAVFGFFKAINLQAFADAYRTYDIFAKRSRAYALPYPFLELLLAGWPVCIFSMGEAPHGTRSL